MAKRRRFKTNFVAKHRRWWPLRKLARLCEKYLDAYENWSYDLTRNGERRVLERLMPTAPKTLFDVGANVGNWTAMARELLPGAGIHCFEIAPPTAERLIRRFADDERVFVTCKGLSNHEGDVSIVYYPTATGLTSLHTFPHRQASQRIQGFVTVGDTYVAERGITQIDFLKVDVEGAEWQVLEGFASSLDKGVIQTLQFEYGRKSILTKYLLRDLHLLLEANGFVVGKIYPTYVDFRAYRLQDEDFRGPNYLAVRRDRTDLIAAFG